MMNTSRNKALSSQYHHHITMPMRFVAICVLYSNKKGTWRDKIKMWQYVESITTNGDLVVIVHLIATKYDRRNNFCCNTPESL
jgi:hypothetical protein